MKDKQASFKPCILHKLKVKAFSERCLIILLHFSLLSSAAAAPGAKYIFQPVMGQQNSTPPPPSPLLRTPWRETSWEKNEELLKYVKDFELQNEAKAIRVLLYGPIGVGKSSFINSVSNVLRGRMTTEALVSSITSGGSFTKKYETHKIKKESRGNFYPFVFNDIMGLEDGNGRGVRVEDLTLALEGHVMEGYKFNPGAALSERDPGYNSCPSIDDRVHVLVCIYSADAPEMKPSVLNKMKEMREAASALGIPQLAILSHVDKACGETQKDLKNVYKSKHLKKKLGDFSSSVGIPMNCILPLKNYSDEIDLNQDVNALILNALKLIIDFGHDYIDNRLS